MKKTIALLTMALGAVAAFGQGTVVFQNSVLASPPSRLVFNTDGTTPLTGTNYVAELYYGADAASLQPLLVSRSLFKLSTTSVPGTWNGKTLNGTLPGGGVGQAVTLAVKVWDIQKFATYEAALGNGITGGSQPFIYTQNLSVPPATTDTQMLNFAGFTLVPEPSAIALSILGVAGLLLIRRRR